MVPRSRLRFTSRSTDRFAMVIDNSSTSIAVMPSAGSRGEISWLERPQPRDDIDIASHSACSIDCSNNGTRVRSLDRSPRSSRATRKRFARCANVVNIPRATMSAILMPANARGDERSSTRKSTVELNKPKKIISAANGNAFSAAVTSNSSVTTPRMWMLEKGPASQICGVDHRTVSSAGAPLVPPNTAL